ncbi:MAG: DUF6288 domain-containing protein [Roseibacillus sp.]
MNHSLLLAFSLSLTFLANAKDPEVSSKLLDFTQGASLPQNTSHDWTLGPTGARGWVQVSADGAPGTTRQSRQILITKVSPDGPSKGLLQKGDVIVGLGETPFESDARIAFAKAISPAEASPSGELKLLRFRGGETETIAIKLEHLPAFSPTAPFDCPKSEKILQEGCDALVARGLGRPSIDSHINALALLATGDRSYEEAIAEHAHKTFANPLGPNISLACWHYSFANIFLCEYYLLTKDPDVLPEIRRLTGRLVEGQGPIGTWGHTFVNPDTDRLNGYGAVNAVGVPVATSLVLARECGISFTGLDESIELAANFFRRHIGMGAIPYGDGPPNLQYGHDDNGKNSAAAIFYSLLNDKAACRYYTRTAIAAYGADREQGHTGNFFNMLWSLPAVSLAGPAATGSWLQEFGWYYDLARDSEYRFPYQGYPRQRGNSPHHSWKTPGAYLLHFALPLKKLRITGRDVGNVPQLTANEISESIEAGKINYRYASVEYLRQCLSSWSPIVRNASARELRRRKVELKTDATLSSTNPLDRIAAIRSSKKFEQVVPLLADKDITVQVVAISKLAGQNKPRALEEVFKHLAKNKAEAPIFTQAIGNTFFPLGVSSQAVGKLLNAPKDRKATIAAVNILLADEDALVSSRIAMGLQYLPEKELYPLLPGIYEQAFQLPEGNIMFANKLRVSCAETLTALNLEEGVIASTAILSDMGWGKNSRLPFAARLVLKYKGHAKEHLQPVKEAAATLKGGGDTRWRKLLEDTIKVIEAEEEPKEKLKTIKELTQ